MGLCLKLGLLGATIPVKGAAQAFFKIDLRVIAEEIAGLRDVRLRIANVAVARGIVLGFHTGA